MGWQDAPVIGSQADWEKAPLEGEDRARAALAQPVQPDRQAAITALAQRARLPVDVVSRNFDEVQSRQAVADLPYADIQRQTPHTADWLAAAPENPVLAKDDLPRLGWLEWMLTTPGKAFRQSQDQMALGNLYFNSMGRPLTADEQKQATALEAATNVDLGAETWFGKGYVGFPTLGAQLLEQTRRGLKTGLPLGMAMGGSVALAGQLGPQVALPEEIATVPLATAIGVGAGIRTEAARFGFEQEAGFAYREYSQFEDEQGRKIDPQVARMAALTAGMLNAGLEVVGLEVLLKSIPGSEKLVGAGARKIVGETLKIPTVRAALLDAAKTYGSTMLKETAVEVAQRAVTIMAGEAAKVAEGMNTRTAGDIGADLGQEAVGAAQAFTFVVAPGAVAGGAIDVQRARQAKQREEFFSALGEGAKDSKLAQRMPEKLRELVARATADGPLETVYIPAQEWQTLMQSKDLDPGREATRILGSRTAYDEALATGGDLAIPMADYASKLAPTDLNGDLAKVLRLHPGDMNAKEADAFVAEQQQAAENQAAPDPLQPVRDDLTGQLLGVGYDRQTAESLAELQTQFYGRMAEYSGMTPEAMLARFPVNVQADIPEVLKKVGTLDGVDNLLDRYRAGQIPSEKLAYGETVTEFVRRMGGIRPDEAIDQGELKARDLGKIGRGLRPLVNKSSAKNLEQMAEVAHEAGYIQNYDYHELLDAIDRDLSGQKVYSATGGAGSTREAGDPQARAQRDLFDELARWLDSKGLDINRMTNEEVKAQLVGPQGQTLEQAGTAPMEAERQRALGEIRDLNRQLEELKATPQRRRLLKLGKTPAVLRALGAPDLPMVIEQHEFAETTHKTPAKEMRRLPVLLADPVAVFQGTNPKFPDRFVIMTDAKVDGVPLMAVVQPAGETNMGPANLVVSVHPRHNARSVPEWVEAGRLRYLTNEESRIEAAAGGVQFPAVPPQSSPGVTVLRTPDVFKGPVGGTLQQPADGGPAARGSVTFPADRSRFDIRLMKDANLSTFLHESGHQFLEVMGVLAQEQPGSPLAADYQTLLDWFGVKSRDEIKVEHHEKFARGFEAYLMEGKAPSPALRSVFARFRAWLVGIYRNALALRVQLNDDVRAVMDRMLATEEQIAAAEAEASVLPLFATADEAGMTPEQFAVYRKTAAEAGDKAREQLQAKLMSALTREQQAWWKAERDTLVAEVAAEVHQRPEYVALANLQKGTQPDGSPLPEGMKAVKLRKSDLEAAYGKSNRPKKGETFTPNTLMNKLRDLKVWSADGVHPEAAANYFGYSTAEDLVLAIANARPMRQLIEAEADARMRERYPDIRFDGSLADEARALVQNGLREKVLEAELRALRRKEREVRPFVRQAVQAERQAGQAALAAQEAATLQADQERATARREGLQAIRSTTPSMETLRALAQQIVARRKVRDLRPDVFLAAARRYGKRAVEMAAQGEKPINAAPKSGRYHSYPSGYAAAADAKQQELLNHLLYLEAVKARDAVDATLEFVKKADSTKGRDRLGKAGFLEQWDAILDRFSFRRMSGKAADRQATLAQWVAEQEAAGMLVDLSPAVLDEARREPYLNLTFEELVGVRDSLKQIQAFARRATRIRKAADAFEWEVAKGQLLDRALASAPGGKSPPISVYEEGNLKRFGRAAVEFADALVRPETLMEWLDGGAEGPWHDFFWDAANTAEYSREALRKRISEPLKALSDKVTRKRRLELQQAVPIASLGRALNRRTLISMALNLGNAGNRERLMRGGIRDGAEVLKLSETTVAEVVDALTAEDWQMVQTIWDTIDQLWPEIKAFEERLTGQAPPRVEATPIQTRHGEFRGGYFPAVYDPYASKAGQRAAEADTSIDKLFSNFTQAATGKGHTKARTGVAGPLLLDFERVISRHVDQVITDLTHREFVIDALKILNDRDLRLAIQDRQGAVAWASLQAMLRHAVHSDYGFNDTADRMLSKLSDRLISNTAVAALGFKVVTAVGNLVLAPVQAAARVSPTWILRGFGQFYRNPTGMAAFVHERSPMMAQRADNWDASFVEILGKLRGERGIRAQAARVAMSVHRAADWIGVHGIWMGAYQEALEAGATEADAAKRADKAIRTTQTAGAPKDLSAVERSALLRKSGLTLFLGPMVIMGNRLREATQRRGVVKHWPEAFGTMLAVWFLPAILWPLATGRDLGKDDDDSSDEWLYLLRQVFLYPFQTAPVLREAATALDYKLSGGQLPARGNPVVDAMNLVADAAVAAGKAGVEMWEGGDPDTGKAAEKALRAAGPLVGVPTGQPLITGEFLMDVYTGQYEPETPLDWRYLVVQRPKELRD